MEYVIDAENIKCEGCASTIREALGKIPGVEEVSVDIVSGRVTVTAPDDLRAALLKALETSGYPEKM